MDARGKRRGRAWRSDPPLVPKHERPAASRTSWWTNAPRTGFTRHAEERAHEQTSAEHSHKPPSKPDWRFDEG